MMENPHSQPPSLRSVLPVAMLILFGTLAGFAGSAEPSFVLTDQIAARASNSLPSKVVTTDGQTYHAVKLLRVLPDGLLIQYQPDSGGMGLARLKFTKLSKSLQQQFGYDPRKASDYQAGERMVMTELARRMREDENIRIGVLDATTRSSVVVKAVKPVVKYAYYDPTGSKPPQISDGMDGVTQYAFGCSPAFNFQVTHPTTGEPFGFRIKTVTVNLDLVVRITLPRGEHGTLKEHEEGHRKIVEYFYSLGPAAAQSAAGLLTGIEQTSSAVDYATARTETFTRATDEVQAEYMKYIRDLCEQANDYYDELTDHGRNGKDSNQAAEEAIRRYAPHVAS
jgi:hypothetical protein